LTDVFTDRKWVVHPSSELGAVAKLDVAASQIRDALDAIEVLKTAYTSEEQRLRELANAPNTKQQELAEILKDHYIAVKLQQETTCRSLVRGVRPLCSVDSRVSLAGT